MAARNTNTGDSGMSIPQALESLRPGAKWTLIGDTLTWTDTSQTEPTKTEIDAEIIRLEYVQNRREDYPDIADQLDMIYKDIDDWKSKVKTISCLSSSFFTLVINLVIFIVGMMIGSAIFGERKVN